MAKILSISRDLNLLRTREMMLSQLGHDTTSLNGVEHASDIMARRTFDLLILGHSLLPQEKVDLGKLARSCCPVLELSTIGRSYAESAVAIEPFDPELFITTVQRILGSSQQRSNSPAHL